MRLSTKHPNVQQTVVFSDFTGGLNTADSSELIGANELSRAVNVEIYKGNLKTVPGTAKVYVNDSDGIDFVNLIYDRINNRLILTATNKTVWLYSEGAMKKLGTLTGSSSVQYAPWEDGVLIASGGKLQYYNGSTFATLDKSPSVCHGVFIKNGRVWVYFNDELHCSAVGDETNWTNDTNDESSSQWLQVGYKDGGYITGVESLSSDTLIFKSNHYAYHLSGTYPNWTLSEIGRQIECKGYNECVALADSTLTLGKTSLQAITVTDSYGDMKATDASAKVYAEIEKLSDVKLRYIPSLNQVWFVNPSSKQFLFLDVTHGGFYHREYTSPVQDVCETADGTIYILKAGGLYKSDSTSTVDEGIDMIWNFQAKTLTSNNEFLVKRVRVDTTPYNTNYVNSTFYIEHVKVLGAVPPSAMCIYHDYTTLYHSTRYILNRKYHPVQTNSDEIYENPEYIYGSETFLKAIEMYRAETRCVDRHRAIRTRGRGYGGSLTIHQISFDIAEV